MGDIGTHALNLAEYVSGLKVTELCADLTTLVEGRPLDDDGNVLVRYNNGARGIIYASQISAGEENGLRIRIYGDKVTEDDISFRANVFYGIDLLNSIEGISNADYIRARQIMEWAAYGTNDDDRRNPLFTF